MTALLTIVGFLVKINIDINYIEKDIKELKIKNAEIDSLKTKVAEIDNLLAGETEVGKFKSTCPEGQYATTVDTNKGLEVVCK